MNSRTIVIAFAVVTELCGCRAGKQTDIPEELVGVWKTSAPAYAGRFFELRKDAVIFGMGGEEVSVHTIFKTEKVQEDKWVLYTIYYTDNDGRQSQWSFYYASANGGVIRFKNQTQIEWIKKVS